MSGRDADQQCDVLFAGGGTGGHLIPGLAVAEALQSLSPGIRLRFLGSDRPIEAQIMRQHPWSHATLSAVSPAQAWRQPWRFLSGNVRAWWTARRLLQTWRPRVVVGLGGFSAVPTLSAAVRQRQPMVLLEPNAIPGRATRVYARSATHICLGMDAARHHLQTHARITVTGSPTFPVTAVARSASERPGLLILGGSQGAEGLNRAVVAWLKTEPAGIERWRIVHQTGGHGRDWVERETASLPFPVEVRDFFEDLRPEYARASLVIARAGAATLAELALYGLPSWLIPFPQAADDHQRANAAVFVAAGAARVIEQDEATTGLTAAWSVLQDEPAQLTQLSTAARGLSRPDAAVTVAAIIRDLVSATTY